MMKFIRGLLKNIPSDNFKLSMKGYKSTGSYVADGILYETFINPENKMVQITVEVDTLNIVDVAVGRYRI